MALMSPGPRIATTAIARSRLGSASITSISRMTAGSTQPRTEPPTGPNTMPRHDEIVTAQHRSAGFGFGATEFAKGALDPMRRGVASNGCKSFAHRPPTLPLRMSDPRIHDAVEQIDDEIHADDDGRD